VYLPGLAGLIDPNYGIGDCRVPVEGAAETLFTKVNIPVPIYADNNGYFFAFVNPRQILSPALGANAVYPWFNACSYGGAVCVNAGVVNSYTSFPSPLAISSPIIAAFRIGSMLVKVIPNTNLSNA